MSVKPEDFLQESKSIFSNASTEIQYRCAISRSYYAMYHKVLSILDQPPRSYPRLGDHASLIEYLKSDAELDESLPFNKLKGLSYMLRQERAKRNEADYDLEDNVSKEEAAESIATAKRCVARCDELKPDSSQLSSQI
ncbi:TPA: HEPN domain-containing protein [Vibrio alginolyticus]|uniref:HEPN domain-containing protein n=1 Tax=Vibrio TaxID=662 RepID=UPI000793221C|nr:MULTISPECIES: HEPN domain-containing protein [Vibrio]EHH1259593.1 HEPN domain-containing protein [Vibrio parahaemolyticus]EIE5865659.1 HEPN domain-containing protein [Vibrio alginolyticus]EKA5859541.1 HEPN domain-containing protein [Vibrio alginolyticus]KXZ38515.1 hypothetical protein A0H77_01560 [Vibrio alginolyticus]MBS9882401.1 HEPN domain-containing protein [Vibrio alginolyticus]